MEQKTEQGTEPATCNETSHTVAEAAYRMGISERAVRARIRRGTLHAVKVTGRYGGTWHVTLPGNDQAGDAVRPETEPAPPTWGAERAALLDQIAWFQNHTAELTRLLDAERQERAALSARPLRMLPETTTEQRPWWKFWKG